MLTRLQQLNGLLNVDGYKLVHYSKRHKAWDEVLLFDSVGCGDNIIFRGHFHSGRYFEFTEHVEDKSKDYDVIQLLLVSSGDILRLVPENLPQNMREVLGY